MLRRITNELWRVAAVPFQQQIKEEAFPFFQLPPELQLECLKWAVGDAPGKDWLHVCLSCQHLLRLCHDAVIWHHFCCHNGLDVASMQPNVEKGDSSCKRWKELFQHRLQHLIIFKLGNAEISTEADICLSEDKLTVVKTVGNTMGWRCTSRFPWSFGIHYFEVTVNNTRGPLQFVLLPVSMATTRHGLIGYQTLGWTLLPASGLILGNKGKRSFCGKKLTLNGGDIIGVYLDIDAGHLLFFWNQQYLVGLKDKQAIREQGPYYASVGLPYRGEQVTFNFSTAVPAHVLQFL